MPAGGVSALTFDLEWLMAWHAGRAGGHSGTGSRRPAMLTEATWTGGSSNPAAANHRCLADPSHHLRRSTPADRDKRSDLHGLRQLGRDVTDQPKSLRAWSIPMMTSLAFGVLSAHSWNSCA